MEEKVLSNLGGVGMYGVISICIFFAFFTGMLVWAACLKKKYLNSMGGLPLDGEAAPQNPVEETSHTKASHE
jgi:hypothetical protein